MRQYRYTDELYHHGVKGMKWGVVRRKSNTAKTERKKVSLKDKLTKAAMIGALSATTTLAFYGGYKISSFLDSCSYTINGKSVSRKEFATTITTMAKSLL